MALKLVQVDEIPSVVRNSKGGGRPLSPENLALIEALRGLPSGTTVELQGFEKPAKTVYGLIQTWIARDFVAGSVARRGERLFYTTPDESEEEEE